MPSGSEASAGSTDSSACGLGLMPSPAWAAGAPAPPAPASGAAPATSVAFALACEPDAPSDVPFCSVGPPTEPLELPDLAPAGGSVAAASLPLTHAPVAKSPAEAPVSSSNFLRLSRSGGPDFFLPSCSMATG